jgi:hypothetical protein
MGFPDIELPPGGLESSGRVPDMRFFTERMRIFLW